MEALIYDDSPLAHYLEGDAIPCEKPVASPPPTPQFAPRGLPILRDQLRLLRRTATSVTDRADERFLEQFRYTVVASRLLSDDPKPRARPFDDETNTATNFSVRGVVITAGFSFSIALLLHWLRRRRSSLIPVTWTEICLYFIISVGLVSFLATVAWRQYIKFVRRSAAVALSRLVAESHNLDAAVSSALRYVQEVEIVSRGYEISHPLPPVSRLDDKPALRQCRQLRGVTVQHLNSSLALFSHFHDLVQPFLNTPDVSSYYHIYDVSIQDFDEALKLAAVVSNEMHATLRDLRFLFELHVTTRKIFLIDLLALRANSTFSDVIQWRTTLQAIQSLAEHNEAAGRAIRETLTREEFPDLEEATTGNEKATPTLQLGSVTPEKQHVKAQMRRFEAVANGVRSLGAKVRLLREDVSGLVTVENPDRSLTDVLTKHYEHVGSELRALLVEWERGRNTMFLHADPNKRGSRSSSGLRSPMSPSPSLGGLTIVEGGPADALLLLNGEDGPHNLIDSSCFDEEVFEAVAKPRNRMSLGFTREEKIAKMQEERKKRATLQEQSEATTSMLRELQMVMKHRPQNRPDARLTLV